MTQTKSILATPLAPVESAIYRITTASADHILFHVIGSMHNDPDFRYWLAQAASCEGLTLDPKPAPVVY